MIQAVQESSSNYSLAAEQLSERGEGTYQSICKPALLCFLTAIFSLGALLSESLIILPILGLVLFAFAVRSFRRFPQELVGRKLMVIGGIANALLLVSSAAWHIYCFNTEVPPDHQRIRFSYLKPEKGRRVAYSTRAEELDGQRVFIKGYVRPSDRKLDLQEFILVGDFGQCCFGGNPKIDEVIEVSFQNDLRIDYGWGLRHIGGIFRLNKDTKRTSDKEVPKALYTIEADYLR
jgi:hypothetical protein